MELEQSVLDRQQQFRWTRVEICDLCQELGVEYPLPPLPWNQQQHELICRDFIEFLQVKHQELFEELCGDFMIEHPDLAHLGRAILFDELSHPLKKLRIASDLVIGDQPVRNKRSERSYPTE